MLLYIWSIEYVNVFSASLAKNRVDRTVGTADDVKMMRHENFVGLEGVHES